MTLFSPCCHKWLACIRFCVCIYLLLRIFSILFNSYFSPQFDYCPLIWINHNKSMNKKITNLHERALRLIYCDHSSNFQELLQKVNSVTMYQKNMQALAIMMYKVVNNIAPTMVSELFSFSNVNHSLRSDSQFHQPSTNTVWNGQENISYLRSKIWNMVPEEMKEKSSLFAFKREIKQWVPNSCSCRICKNYLPDIYPLLFLLLLFFFGFDTSVFLVDIN